MEGYVMIDEILQIILLISTCVFAMLTVEMKDLLHTIISLACMAISLGAIFWLLNAPYVAVFQILVYAGAVIVLFIAAVMLTRRK
ncbi:MAG: NADH-quinone oxidoreductase subunit J family protein [Candidatus Bathyarchaeia archaeon]